PSLPYPFIIRKSLKKARHSELNASDIQGSRQFNQITVETYTMVCRYVQSPEMLSDSQCADCDIRENLWICLICGHVGCGRYGQKHAQVHFEETGHTFALELGKTLVWDYADDAYVHRLAVNHEDGKLVQVLPCQAGRLENGSLRNTLPRCGQPGSDISRHSCNSTRDQVGHIQILPTPLNTTHLPD
ncbi:unnamed protein product, partial [Schistosoma mattheei]